MEVEPYDAAARVAAVKEPKRGKDGDPGPGDQGAVEFEINHKRLNDGQHHCDVILQRAM